MPYVGKEYVQTYIRSHAGPYSIAEREEIERRRKKLNSGRMLSDEQLLQICDPGPTTEETEKMERRERGDSDDRTWTPLMWAAKEGHDPVVKELLAGGADISCTSKNGSTAPSLAKKYGHEKCVELLERAKKSGMVGDKEYRGKGSARQAKPANSTHALFNTRDKDGKTPAHAASENGHADTLRVVIKGGCSIHVTDEVGCTPAHYAAMNGHDGCLAVIVELGGDFRSKNEFGFTPLRLALRNRHATSAALLRDAIAKMDGEPRPSPPVVPPSY